MAASETPHAPLPPIRGGRLTALSPAAPTPYPLLIVAMCLVIAPLIVASQIAAHLRYDVVDDQMFGYFGWRIAHGGTVYLDVWDNKPPGIYWINALGFLLSGGDSYAGVVVLCVLALLVTHACFFMISASVYFRGAAAVATVLASFYITHGFYQGGTNRTETFLIAFELAGVLAYVRGCPRGRGWLFFLAGVLCGCAFLLKQVGLAAWGAMGLHTILLALLRDISFAEGLRRCLLLLAGAVLSIGAAVGVLAAQGALQAAWFAIFTFNRAYFEVGATHATDTFLNRHFLWNHMMPILRLPVLMAIAALVHATLWWLRPNYRPPEIERPLREFQPACPRFLVLFVIWYIAAFYGAAVSPHHFRHYLIPTLPPLLLICGYIVNVIKTELGLLNRLQQRGWVVAAFVLMGWLAIDAFQIHLGEVARVWIYRFDRHKRADWEVIGDEVRRLTSADQTIHCWGYFPGVYLDARRLNACRFITTEKIGQVGQRAETKMQVDELMDTFKNRPPAVLVVSDEDYNWFMDPRPTDQPRGRIGEFLAGWLDASYLRMAEIPTEYCNVFVYQRRDLADTSRALPVATQPSE